jgi:thioesterase domain-containing protein/acyl carrier protein
MVPSRLIPIDALPLLPNGKIDRQSLIDRAVAAGGSTTAAATNAVEAQLMRIWDDLIDFPEIGRDDNFFELGGHSLLVPRLTDRVQRDFGVSLPIAAVFQAPTIRQLAEVIRQQGPNQVIRCVVAIRESGDRPPLFMIHGLGGEIGYFYNLAEYLDPQQPVYGVQAPPEPFDRIEPMAAHYVKEIRSRYPRGPYFLAGYCVGGCVAYEMAQQLVASGDSVPFLALLDSVMPGPQSLGRRLESIHQTACRTHSARDDALRGPSGFPGCGQTAFRRTTHLCAWPIPRRRVALSQRGQCVRRRPRVGSARSWPSGSS